MTIGRIGRGILFVSALAAPGSLEAQLCNGELCPGRIWNPPGVAWDQQALYVPTRDEYFITTTEWTFAAGGLLGRFVGVDGTLNGGIITLLPNANAGVTSSALAYNPDRNEILLIARHAEPFTIIGMFLGADGQPISGAFGLGEGEEPRVAYSPHSQRYLVTWSRRVSNVYNTYYAVVNGDSTNPAVLGTGLIDSNALSVVEAYATASGKFLVVYTVDFPPPRRADIYGRFVSADGTPGTVFPIDTTVDNQQMPRIAYSATHDRFLVAYEDWSEASGWSANATASLLDSNGGVIRRFPIARTGAWDVAGPMAFSTTAQSFLVTWRTATNTSNLHYAQELSPVDGSPKAPPVFVSGLNIGLMSIGVRNHLTDPKALILWRNVFGEDGVHAGVFDFVTPITTVLSVESPATNSGVLQPFTVSGYAIDPGAPSGTGVDLVHVWGYPAGGGSVFLGSATYGGARPDVATAFGDARFTNSGFTLNVNGIANGNYTVRVHARSTLTGNFDVSKTLNLSVGPDPRMNVDAPAAGGTVAAPFEVRGWAIDRAASSGTGVDAVHLWAFPAGSTTGTFLGAATYGGSRPDVATSFGNSQFQNSGFSLLASKYLPAGDYTLQVWARSTVTGTFSNSMNVPVKIVGVNHLNVDTPVHGGGVGGPFSVTGWALHTGSATGSGINAVHVWAISTANGAATFLGSATLGISRPDVAAFFGEPRFEPSGYRLDTGPLAPGGWVIRVYARNAATGQFEISRDILVNTVGSSPLAAVDRPSAGNVSVPFVVSGWSVDLNASSGTGIDVIHVWATPHSGGSSIFLGSATLGISRPDVAAYFGEPGFSTSGYSLNVNALAPGTYTLVVWSRSLLSSAFTAASPVVITVP